MCGLVRARVLDEADEIAYFKKTAIFPIMHVIDITQGRKRGDEFRM